MRVSNSRYETRSLASPDTDKKGEDVRLRDVSGADRSQDGLFWQGVQTHFGSFLFTPFLLHHSLVKGEDHLIRVVLNLACLLDHPIA